MKGEVYYWSHTAEIDLNETEKRGLLHARCHGEKNT